jgi:glycosyltransferase involved in cell wall biosynthesis
MSRRVALLASTTTEDSAEMLTLRLRYLLERGWDAWLFCKGAPWLEEPALRDPDVRDRIELAPKAKTDASPFDGRLRSLEPHLVHFHSAGIAWKGLRRGQLRGARIAVSFRTDGHDLALAENELDLVWERADRLFFPSRAALERAIESGCPEERAIVLEPPAQIPGPEHWREGEDGPLRVLSAGPLVWEQGFEHSIHAIRLLLDQGVPCEYRIIGDGSHAAAVAFARHQLGLHDHVHLLPQDGVGQLPRELRSADVFVDPAVAETTASAPLVTAQAHGVPYVATARRPPLPDGAGVEVPRRDPQAIAVALAQLAADPAMRERMGRQAERLSGAWLIEDHLAELDRLYGAMLGLEPA